MKDQEIKNFTHGELALVKVEKAPTGKTGQHKKYIAAHSETGHHHVIQSAKPFTITETDDGLRHLTLESSATLSHQKTHDIHVTRTLQPGAYRMTEKTEYNPFTKVIQRVFD